MASSNFNYEEYNVYSPDGSLLQFNYTQKATELGNTCLGLKNNKIGVLIAHNPKRTKLAESVKKIFKIDDVNLFAFSGITNDGLNMANYLKEESLYQHSNRERSIHPIHVFKNITYDRSYNAMFWSDRLVGVSGLLMSEYENKIVLVEILPCKVPREMHASAIGYRNQSCRTILSNHCSDFINENASEEEMIRAGIKGMLNAHPENDQKSALKPEDLEIYLFKVGEGYKMVDPVLYFK